ncbi:hypothetical protein [Pontibacter russatus]|uniref:hypothetical protein n=1 Tax=Pontibacter russatus TaxID=2694929 RepID=UPI00137B0431|nr:hypothetical protein [Pontibacter russatus]
MFRIFSNLNRKALLNAFIAMVLVIALVYIGSRDLQNFDAALIAYLFGTVFAVFGIIYRYSVWLQGPPPRSLPQLSVVVRDEKVYVTAYKEQAS